MAAVPVTIIGVETDDTGISRNVTIIGMASITGLGVGGGPIVPKPPVGIWPGPGDPDFPGGGKPPGQPPTIWPGPGDPDFPGGGKPPVLPPDVQPPQPGDPVTVVPGTQPAHPIVPPPFIVVEYPGIGKVIVPPPAQDTAPPA